MISIKEWKPIAKSVREQSSFRARQAPLDFHLQGQPVWLLQSTQTRKSLVPWVIMISNYHNFKSIIHWSTRTQRFLLHNCKLDLILGYFWILIPNCNTSYVKIFILFIGGSQNSKKISCYLKIISTRVLLKQKKYFLIGVQKVLYPPCTNFILFFHGDIRKKILKY